MFAIVNDNGEYVLIENATGLEIERYCSLDLAMFVANTLEV